jgi:PAS domain S-box-containing protein
MDYGLRPCAIAGSFVLVALLWTFPLQHYTAYPFVFLFLGSIVGSAWFGGLIAGFLATALSYLLITFLFIPPLYSVSVGREFRSYAASYVIFAVVITVVGSARKRAETAIRTARDELETRVQERTVELQHSNQEILGRERQLRLLAEAIPQQIWSADATGCIEYCNHDLIRHIGKNIDELRGEAFYTIFHPEDILPFRDSWEAARKTTGNFEVQARIRGANGAYRWFLVRAVPQRDLDEKVVRWYGVHIDIEEQRRLQQGLSAGRPIAFHSHHDHDGDGCVNCTSAQPATHGAGHERIRVSTVDSLRARQPRQGTRGGGQNCAGQRNSG